jgi:hypothetical protein
MSWATADVALVTAADKLHNLNSLIRDVRRDGAATLNRFNAPDRQVWYFKAIANACPGTEPAKSAILLAFLMAFKFSGIPNKLKLLH